MRRKKYMTRKEINEMKKRWREALATPTKPLHDPVPLGEIMDAYLEGKGPCEDCISRAEAIDALGYDISIESDEGLDAYKTVIKEMLCKIYDVQKENIEKLPSIKPKPKTDVLGKIRAEIDKWHHLTDKAFNDGIDTALEIIDKYKAKSEDSK